ncbi:hypothetical protein PAMP_011039 [Pampus punctatissimus]
MTLKKMKAQGMSRAVMVRENHEHCGGGAGSHDTMKTSLQVLRCQLLSEWTQGSSVGDEGIIRVSWSSSAGCFKFRGWAQGCGSGWTKLWQATINECHMNMEHGGQTGTRQAPRLAKQADDIWYSPQAPHQAVEPKAVSDKSASIP